MELTELRDLVSLIRCEVGGIVWNVYADRMGNGYYIQLRYIEPDIETGDPEDQHSRKWYISSHATPSEIVQTVLKACLTSGEHMIREHFTYKGYRILGPHFDIEQLVELCKREADSRDVRRTTNAPSQIPQTDR